MFDWIRNFTESKKSEKDADKKQHIVNTGIGLSINDSVNQSTQEAMVKYAKPEAYDRSLFDGTAKQRIKVEDFSSGQPVYDPYTGAKLELRRHDAIMKYGDDYAAHMAEGDHITPIKKVYDEHKGDAFLTVDDIKETVNSKDNLVTVSRKTNNAKRARTNQEFAEDKDYRADKGIHLTKNGKKRMISDGKRSAAAIESKLNQRAFSNALETGHHAGLQTAGYAVANTATISTIMNFKAVFSGEKDVREALIDIAKDTGKGAATGYVMGGGLTVASKLMCSSSSPLLQSLGKANVPAQVVTGIMVAGDVLRQYAKGEISTEECMLSLGQRGVSMATASYGAAVGQIMIPIPVVGAALGAMVATMATDSYCKGLMQTLQNRQLAKQERERIQAECQEAIRYQQQFRQEFETYVEQYFSDCQECFANALANIRGSMLSGDANGVIAGANKITRKLGGQVHYDNMAEFDDYLMSKETDIL